MKYLLLFLFVSICISSSGQDISLREKIVQTVKQIDKNKKQVAGFSTTKNKYFTYKTSNGKLVKLTYLFKNDSTKTEQIFYINNGKLIYSTEDEVLYSSKDSSIWRGTYFFANGRLKDYETLGHGKSELDDWEPEKEMVNNYKRVRNIITAHIKQKSEPK